MKLWLIGQKTVHRNSEVKQLNEFTLHELPRYLQLLLGIQSIYGQQMIIYKGRT